MVECFVFLRPLGPPTSVASLRLLSLIDEVGQGTVTRLADLDQCSQPTMTAAINQLVQRGWATKVANPADARSSLIAITPDGAQELAAARDRNGAEIARRLAASGHTPEELERTVRLLADLLGQHG